MHGDGDLVRQAATGDVAAQVGLVDLSISLGAAGAVHKLEALMAAETWARLAAASGGVAENRTLAGVLMARSDFEITRGAVYRAQWYEADAQRVLRLLSLMGDAGSDDVLTVVGDCPEPSGRPLEMSVAFASTLARAGKGDLEAVRALYQYSADSVAATEVAERLEGLVASEIYGRIGASQGDLDLMRGLAGTMLQRSEYEELHGSKDLARSAITEGLVLLSILVDCGDVAMADALNILATHLPAEQVADAVCARPDILLFMQPEGNS